MLGANWTHEPTHLCSVSSVALGGTPRFLLDYVDGELSHQHVSAACMPPVPTWGGAYNSCPMSICRVDG